MLTGILIHILTFGILNYPMCEMQPHSTFRDQGVVIKGKSLDAEPFHTIGLYGQLQCVRLCGRTTACQSYNYYRKQLKCALISANSLTHNLTDDNEAVFQEKQSFPTAMVGPCETMSCPTNSECVERSTSAAVCVITACSTLPGPAANAGYIAARSVYSVSDTITFQCNSGLAMSGNPNVKCVATGTWTLPSFSCAGCPSPPNLTNGVITAGESLIGTERTYTCKSGYTSGGSDIKTSCGNDLTWTALTGSCSPVDCGTPPTLSGGSIDTSTSLTTYPVTRSYSCNTGYTTNSGSGSISCQSSGSWSPLALTCTAVDCGEPTVTEANGVVSSGCTTFDCSRIFGCATGYNTGGSVLTVTCQSSGSWTGSSYSCTPVDCGTPPTLSGGSIDTSTSLTTYPVTRTFSCNTGYTANSGSGSISCQSSGSWSSLALTCTAVDCGDPTVTEPNGVVNTGCTTLGCSRTFSCASGYNIGGSVFTVNCQSAGSWTGSSYSCTPVDCGEPTVTEANGVVSSGCTTFDCSRTFGCATGYNIGGSVFTVTCQSSGSWTGSSYSCTLVDCGEPTVTEANGVVSSGCTTFDCSRTFGCATGYNIGGSVFTVTCQSSGSWTGSSYSCTPVDCGEPTVTEANGVVSSGCTTFDCSRTFGCATGYNIGGSVFTVTCQSSGSWTGSSYSCTPAVVTCPAHPVIAYATMTGSGTSEGTTITYTCDVGAILVSGSNPASSTCNSQGDWSTANINCAKCSSYANTYTQRTDWYFNPPVSFTPSISGGSVTASYCANACNTRSDFFCVAYYYRKSTGGYCILRPMRVHDDTNHIQYDNADTNWDEYIRNCN